jgi:hypothetical protein
VISLAEISTKYIGDAIDELTSLLGIKKSISFQTILEPLRAGRIRECINEIANYLGLPVTVNLIFSDRFETHDLAPKDSGQGLQGITAQVSIPGHLPFYGTSELRDLPIQVKVIGDCRKHQEAFAAIMAHELSHIVLQSLWHRHKDNEFYVELTAMVMGFSEAMQRGRRVVETKQEHTSVKTTTTTYGYLSDQQFDFAFNKVQQILREKESLHNELREKVLRRLTDYRRQITHYKEELLRLGKFTEYLDKNRNKTFRKGDIPKILQVHQSHYTYRLGTIARSNEEKMKEITESSIQLLKLTQHFSQRKIDLLRTLVEKLDDLISDLRRESEVLDSDADVLGRYVGFLDRLKMNRQDHHT